MVFTTIDPALVTQPAATGSREPSAGRAGSGTSPSLAEETSESGGVAYVLAAKEGSYKSTPLNTATQWQVGEGSGEFSYSYDFKLPPARAGATPTLSLNYSSGLVDGMAAGNGQSSMTGIGWSDLTVGSITRSFMNCEEDEVGDGETTSVFKDRGDLCWRTTTNSGEVTATAPGKLVDELSLTLNGKSSRLRLLYPDVTYGQQDQFKTDEYRLYDDPGWRVLRHRQITPSGSGLQDNDMERWEVRTPDGTSYFFGSRTTAADNAGSVLTVPVFSNDPGEPGTSTAASCQQTPAPDSVTWCQQAWQWNLDRVVDSHGNEIHYDYTTEINNYNRYNTTSDNTKTPYNRAGALSQIRYGMWQSRPATQGVGLSPARQVVDVTTAGRCLAPPTNPAASCSATPTSSNADQFPDTPIDLVCEGSSTCQANGPSFFSTRRYSQIQTSVVRGNNPNDKTPVASYALTHTYPDPDAHAVEETDPTNPSDPYTPHVDGEEQAALWLLSVRVTGRAGSTDTPAVAASSLPHVYFDGQADPSRVVPVPATDSVGDESDDFRTRFRVFAVRNELGGRIEVQYGHSQQGEPTGDRTCDEAYVDSLENTRWASKKECFAVENPDGDGFEWFHKYVVRKSTTSDDAMTYRYGVTNTANLGISGVTTYEYVGDPAWRFNDSRVVRDGTANQGEAWGDWRGYETTLVRTKKMNPTTEVASSLSHSLTRIVQFRGMNDSKASTAANDRYAGVRVATVEDENGTADGDPDPLDEAWFNGLTAETELKYPDNTPGQPGVSDLIRRDYTSYKAYTLLAAGSTETLGKRIYKDYTNTTTRLTAGSSPSLRTHRVDYETFDGNVADDPNDPNDDPQQLHRGILAGVVKATWDRGDASTGADDICTQVDYATNALQWHYAEKSRVVYDDDCFSAGVTGSGPVVRQSRSFYDNSEDTPATGDDNQLFRGRLTQTSTSIDASATTIIKTQSDYDDYGRVTLTCDGVAVAANGTTPCSTTASGGTGTRGKRTLTEYNPPGTPAGVDPLGVLERTRVTEIQGTLGSGTGNAPDLVTVTDIGPATAAPTRIIDPNSKSTWLTYDGLGRLSKVFLPTNATAYPSGTASMQYFYTHSLRDDAAGGFPDLKDRPTRVRTITLKDKGTPGTTLDSYEFYDGWGRLVETQAPSPSATAGKRIVTSTGYDERGLTAFTSATYARSESCEVEICGPTLTAPYATVVNPDPDTLARWQRTSYDAASRPSVVDDRNQSTSYRSTSTYYYGDRSLTKPDDLGATTTLIDVWDRPVRTQLLTGDAGTTVGDEASYTYTAAGDLDTITKPLPGVSGNVTWDYDYDLAGRKTKAVDPDTGLTTTSYDRANNTTSTTTYAATTTYGQLGALQDKIETDYDDLNRSVKRRDTTQAATGDPGRTMAQWFYDTAPTNGLGRLAATETSIKSVKIAGTSIVLFGPASGDDWHTNKLIGGYDANGRPTSTTTRYPSWLTDETPSTGTNPVAGTLAADANVAVTHTRTYDELDNTLTLTYPATPGDQPASGDFPATSGPLASLTFTSTYENTGGRYDTTSYGSQTLGDATYDSNARLGRLETYSENGTDRTTWRRDYTWESYTGRLSMMTVGQRTGPNAQGPHTDSPIELGKWFYQYDRADQPQRISTSRQNLAGGLKSVGALCYDYDGLGRLTLAFNGSPADPVTSDQTPCTKPTSENTAEIEAATGAIYDLGYAYSGDRLAQVNTPSTGSPTNTYAYSWADPTKPHRTTNIQRTVGSGTVPNGTPSTGTIGYDPQGRATSQPNGPGTTTIEYDREGNPVHTGNAYAAYDADGIRIARREPVAGGSATTVFIDGLTEITRNNAPLTTSTVGTHHISTPDGTPLASLNKLGWNWEVADPQGNLRITRRPYIAPTPQNLNPDNKQRRSNYYPYGAPSPAGSDTFATPNKRGYLGKHHDANGDIRLDHRSLTPALNILTAPDPLLNPKDPQNLNPYSYSGNNPIAFADPTGLAHYACGASCDPPWRVTQVGPAPKVAAGVVLTGGTVGIFAKLNFLAAQDSSDDSDFSDFAPPVAGAIGLGAHVASTPPGGVDPDDDDPLGSMFSKSLDPEGLIDPSKVRFSQNSIKAQFSDGSSVKGMTNDLLAGRLKAGDVRPIRLFQKDGKLYSLDNRRLYAFKGAGVNIRYRMATSREISRELGGKFHPINDGLSIKVRGGGPS